VEQGAVRTAIRLWQGVAPGSESWTHDEDVFPNEEGEECVRNVVVPTLTPFLPAGGSCGTAVVVAPGGGLMALAMGAEGYAMARWLNERGVAAFVLKYRLIDTGPSLEALMAEFMERVEQLMVRSADGEPVGMAEAGRLPLSLAAEDARQAVRLLRGRAAEFGIRPDAVGLLGFSAGGLVGAEAALGDDVEGRPDFLAHIYGSFADREVPPDAPPFFGVVAADDELCAGFALQAFQRWRAASVPAELHVYASGGHGFAEGRSVQTWRDRFEDWLVELGYLALP
jgi:acetyl esterase/lipase